MIGITEEDRDKLCLTIQVAFTHKMFSFDSRKLVLGIRPSHVMLGAVISYHLSGYICRAKIMVCHRSFSDPFWYMTDQIQLIGDILLYISNGGSH